MEKGSNDSRRNRIVYVIISFFAVFTILFTMLFIIEKNTINIKNQELKKSEERLVELENEFMLRKFSTVLADLHYLHDAYEKQLKEPDNFDYIAENWSIFSTQRRIYDQIRYIDKNGDEKIRINIGEKGAYAIPKDELQNKKDRYYFYETEKLEKESDYISSLDLNIEQGEVEKPYKPMMRFSTPLYDEEGEFQGIIVLNYLAEDMLKSFRELGEKSQGEVVLLNSDGYWISSEDEDKDWNFMFQDRKENSFAAEFSEEWGLISQGIGQSVTSNGLFTYSHIDIRNKIVESNDILGNQSLYSSDSNWYIVSTVSKEAEHEAFFLDSTFGLAMYVVNKNIAYFLLVLLISLMSAFLFYINRKNYTKIKYYSEYDVLTKTYNRRAGMNKLKNLFPEDDRRRFLVSLCFIDINGLKQVNDTLGHKAGDELIVTVTETIKSTIRDNDFIVRLGGDEFLIVFNGIHGEDAESVWSRIVEKNESVNRNENRDYIISASHGIIDYDNKYKSPVEDLIKIADEKMYKEKRIIKENLNVIRARKEHD